MKCECFGGGGVHSADLDELVGTQTHIVSGAVCAETPDQKLNEEERANVRAGWAWAICLRPAACTGLPPSTFRHNSAHMPHPPRSLLVLLLPLPASLLLLLPQNPKPCPFPLTPPPPRSHEEAEALRVLLEQQTAAGLTPPACPAGQPLGPGAFDPHSCTTR